jgi:hypothetical protein
MGGGRWWLGEWERGEFWEEGLTWVMVGVVLGCRSQGNREGESGRDLGLKVHRRGLQDLGGVERKRMVVPDQPKHERHVKVVNNQCCPEKRRREDWIRIGLQEN